MFLPIAVDTQCTPEYKVIDKPILYVKNGEGVAVKIAPGESKIVKTGCELNVPSDYVAAVYSIPQLILQKNVVTTTGVVEKNFRGEIVINLYNFGCEEVEIAPSEVIAGLEFYPYVDLATTRFR